MITDLTKNGIRLDRYTLRLHGIDDQTQSTNTALFGYPRNPSYREYMSLFHTGSQEERYAKQCCKEEYEYNGPQVGQCPICGKWTLLRRWRHNHVCSQCSLDDTKVNKPDWYKCNGEAVDRTQRILDLINRSY